MDTETLDQPSPEPTSKPRLPFRITLLRFLLAAEIISLILSAVFLIAEEWSPPRPKQVEQKIPWQSQLSTMSRLTGPKVERVPSVKATWKSTLALVSGLLAFALLLPIVFASVASLEASPRLARVGLWTAALAFVPSIFLPAFARAREKPVIYLYPETQMAVNVKLHYPGVLTESIPPYPRDGWQVIASPNGELVDPTTGTKYPYLFWEGRDAHVYAMNEGFVVASADSRTFLQASLTQIGLSSSEIHDFSDYWLPRLQKNAYNFIHFATDEYDQQVPLEVTPNPDTMIRVFMLFRAVDRNYTTTPQTLPHTERRGFTLVEWGGTELD